MNLTDKADIMKHYLISHPINVVTPGSYNTLTINSAGIVTSASNKNYTQALSGGAHLWVQSTTPSALTVGDIWIKI